jgi:hypothetical protein
MPVCPRCGTAYLDGESHVCPPLKHSRGFDVVVGAIGGACLGFGFGWVIGIMTRNALGYVGVPLGAAVGVVLGLMKKPERLNL